jgi:glutathione S-transferase
VKLAHVSQEKPPELVVWGSGTPRTLRVHWMLHELGLEYERHMIGSRTGETRTAEFTALNPRQKIPVLQDGDFVLAESAAIVTYLGERHGARTGLVPRSGTRERARYDEWCFFIMTELDAHTLYIMRRHGDLASLYGDAPHALDAARAGFQEQVAVAAQALAAGGPHLLGDPFTAGDILLVSCLDWAVFYGIPLPEPLPAYRARLTAREAYRRASALNYAQLRAAAPS